jgi:hypothetical protein
MKTDNALTSQPDLPRIKPRPRTGNEPFHNSGKDRGFTVQNFWRWSVSDLLSNTRRGVLAEFIVAKALGLSTDGAQVEWGAFDLTLPPSTTIQVKSSAYLQSWYQERLSPIIFPTKATRFWDPETNELSNVPRRADVYVFALLKHQHPKKDVDPLNLDQWEFYVMSGRELDGYTRSKVSITLKTIQTKFLNAGPVDFDNLSEKVNAAAVKNRQ